MSISVQTLRAAAALAVASAAFAAHAGWGSSMYQSATTYPTPNAAPSGQPGHLAGQAPLPAAKASGSSGGRFVGGWGSSMYQYSSSTDAGAASAPKKPAQAATR